MGTLFLITVAMQFHGLHDNRFLVREGRPAPFALLGVAATMLLLRPRAAAHLAAFLIIGVGTLHAEVKQVRSYQTHEPSDWNGQFAMAVTPDQDVLLLMPKKSGVWRLTRVRNWLDTSQVEQTIDVPGIAVPEKSKDSPKYPLNLRTELLVTPNGDFAIGVATGQSARTEGQRGIPVDNVVSVIDLRTFRVPTAVHQDGSAEHYVDGAGRFVLGEITSVSDNFFAGPGQISWTHDVTMRFLALPALALSGDCDFEENSRGDVTPKDPDCEPSLAALLEGFVDSRGLPYHGLAPRSPRCEVTAASRNRRFRAEYCPEQLGTIISTETGVQIGSIKEATLGNNARFAEQNGRDYLLVLEGGTQLKIYEITEPHP